MNIIGVIIGFLLAVMFTFVFVGGMHLAGINNVFLNAIVCGIAGFTFVYIGINYKK